MKLYHGTSNMFLDKILEVGLTNKEKNNRQYYNSHNNSSFDTHTIMSMPGIYLTTDIDIAQDYAYQSSKKTKTTELILEVDIDKDNLIIDEDNINIEGELKEYLRESHMSTDNDGWFQLKNMIIDEDTSEKTLKELQSWLSTGYRLPYDAIEIEDVRKIVISYINRVAAHLSGYTLPLCFLAEYSKQDIQDIINDNNSELYKKYETIFLKDYNDYILKYSSLILSKQNNNKLFRSLSDIPPENISIYTENILKIN